MPPAVVGKAVVAEVVTPLEMNREADTSSHTRPTQLLSNATLFGVTGRVLIAKPHAKDLKEGGNKFGHYKKTAERHLSDADSGTVQATIAHCIEYDRIAGGDQSTIITKYESCTITSPEGAVLATYERKSDMGGKTFMVKGKAYASYNGSGGLFPRTTIERADASGGLSDLKGDNDPCCPCGAAKPSYGLYSLDHSISYTPPKTKWLPDGGGSRPYEFRFTPDGSDPAHQPLDAASRLDLVLMVAMRMHMVFNKIPA